MVAEMLITLSSHPKKKVPITTIIPLQDIAFESSINSPILSASNNDFIENFSMKLTKKESEKTLSIELVKENKNISTLSPQLVSLQNSSPIENMEVKSFYILYTDNPSINPERLFSNSAAFEDVHSGVSPHEEINKYKSRIIYLDNWKKNSNSEETTFEFKEGNDFWKSTCFDPYKVGGWIDKDLTQQNNSGSSTAAKKTKLTSNTSIKKQLETKEEFKAGVDVKPQQKKQYFWEQITGGDFVPSSDYTTTTPCIDMDEETKELYKTYWNQTLEKEPQERRIKTAPTKEFEEWSGKSSTNKKSKKNSYPKNKIVQSSFRAWGNAYRKGTTVKELGSYSRDFENKLVTEHSFSLKIKKDNLKKKLINHSSLSKEIEVGSGKKKLNEMETVSSLLQLSFPISFTIYDPVTDYVRKKRFSLLMDLDLRSIYVKSHFLNKFFSHDLVSENGYLGKDYKGFDVGSKNKTTNFGLSGFLEFWSGLELDQEKNLLINIKAITRGFVNTKNPTCDLRHRLFKFNTQPKCTTRDGWSYRKHNHIPSYLIITLENEPKVTSFYSDRRIEGIDFDEPKEKTKREKRSTKDSKDSIKTLKEFGENLDSRRIKKNISLDKSNDGEVFYEDISAYDKNTKDSFNINKQVSSGGWWSTNYQFIYYYSQRQSTNFINIDGKNLETLNIILSGSSTLSSYFFTSRHYKTTMTLCYSEKPQTGTDDDGCGDGRKYEKYERDKSSSDLAEHEGNQELKIPWSSIKSKTSESDPFQFNFRTILHRENTKEGEKEDPNRFETVKEKYQAMLKDESPDPTDKDKIPGFSFIAVWYSLEMWWEKDTKKLNYRTKIRPISMISEKQSNEKPDKVIGASGAAGFQISSIEFVYKPTKSN